MPKNLLQLAGALNKTKGIEGESNPQLIATYGCGQQYNNITEVTLTLLIIWLTSGTLLCKEIIYYKVSVNFTWLCDC